MSTGVILARLQPIHNGHLALIEKSLRENSNTYVFVGSADKFNVRNPFPITLRMQMLKEALIDTFGWNPIDHQITKLEGSVGSRTIEICALDDLTDESDNSHDWGFYLYSKIVSTSKDPYFTMYYSDGFEIITTWFPTFILRNNVSLSLLARNATVEGISATKIRQYIVDGNDDMLKEFVPENVFNIRKQLKDHIELANKIKL